MTETRDYSKTLFLPKTDYLMRAGLPKKEPEILKRWKEMDLYKRLREDGQGRRKFILHDGPPYANGNIHIGHALNKTLKDIITRSMQMMDWDSNYVPGWDCHGLPIEWKIEEENYRSKGKQKPDLSDPAAMIAFRQECRAYAKHWIGVQGEEFQRLGIEGDWTHPYLTMHFESEAIIAEELMKFARSGQLYRGSRPIMWSVVEKTALAEAEIEYHDHESDTIWVKFPITKAGGTDEAATEELLDTYVVIWTTTPWTIPGNRAVCFSSRISYGLYEVTDAENDFEPQAGEKLIFADTLAGECATKAELTMERKRDVTANELAALTLAHPLADLGYDFDVPLLDGDHVTDDAGTGFVHTAPGHGADDFEIWMEKHVEIEARGISSEIPFTVDGAGYYTEDAPGFGPDAEGGPAQVITAKGATGDANKRVIAALIAADALFACGRLKHQYPHSWRSKKPVIFRNTPQWFVYMDKELSDGSTLRGHTLKAIGETRFVPLSGQHRLHGMIENRPDWVLSRQRAWGVPITVFRHEDGRLAPGADFDRSDELSARISDAFRAEGADAWYKEGAKERLLGGLVNDMDAWTQVTDILDVWFDSGSTHAFCLEKRPDLNPKRARDGGEDYVLYLEGSDQHRGWFHSSLLESCGTRGHAPYDAVLTHGFTMAEDGRKMSKSLGNQTFPQDVIKQYGADILRLWVASADYTDDQRIGPEILKTNADAYRKMRNTIRWMLGSLAHAKDEDVAYSDMPELERLMLHRLAELDDVVRETYDAFDFKRVFAQIFNFMTVDLSAFYFDIRKDALYCDPISSTRRKAALWVIERLFDAVVTWLAPIMPFTMEESWWSRHGEEAGSVHRRQFPSFPAEWRDEELAERWSKIRTVRRVVTGALEIERAEKRIGSSLEAHPTVYIADPELLTSLEGRDMADICITSQLTTVAGDAPENAFKLDEVPGVGVVSGLAEGTKCARSWKVLPEIGSDPDYPDLTLRDAKAMRELNALGETA
ncbi:isoleucine--tRNA ligase [Breoghania sp.]|uniref:isoleucine--tRNA ligase n=1 Tax=Breoghania sp. TaxID=2065378 RepID=UPI0026391127|nr:isoleucine--tRNA ligase [Breoghania sp.]MDJ0930224.1 isoleucine--tRNA ligase [Breoghania sp.]